MDGAGGSGYYGGAASPLIGYNINGGAGGSSFVSGYGICNAIEENSTEDNIIHTGQSIHYSKKYFILGQMISGNDEMPTHEGNSTMIGNSGNGYAKITKIIRK